MASLCLQFAQHVVLPHGSCVPAIKFFTGSFPAACPAGELPGSLKIPGRLLPGIMLVEIVAIVLFF
jgi:hypothetical protein